MKSKTIQTVKSKQNSEAVIKKTVTGSSNRKMLKKVAKWSAGTTGTGSALIHGNNLTALGLLEKSHAGQVKCVYLDPPYNNGDSYLHYYDNMGHDEWLEAVTARLKIIKTLLREDGSIWISIDDSELHYLKVEADKIFGRANFVGTVVWERRTTRENRKVFSRKHEYLLVYAKDRAVWSKTRNTLPLTDEVRSRYKNPDNDPRGPWQSVTLNVQGGHATPQQHYTLLAPNGKQYNPPKGRCWAYTREKMMDEISKNNVWFGENGNGAPRLKQFLTGRQAGLTPETLWQAKEVGTTSDAKKH